jgi:Asp/Glu/hydantoin racemase
MKIAYQGLSREEAWPDYYQRLITHLAAVADPGTVVEPIGLPKGTLADQYRIGLHSDVSGVLKHALAGIYDGFDAVVIGNTQDAAVRELREILDVPVVGHFEAAIDLAARFAPHIGLTVPHRRFIPCYEELLREYELERRVVCIEPLDLLPGQLNDQFANAHSADALRRMFDEAASRAERAGAEVLVPTGGSIVLFLALAGVREIRDMPVIDGICAVIKKAEMMVKYRALTGTHTSRKLTYSKPDAAARGRLFES